MPTQTGRPVTVQRPPLVRPVTGRWVAGVAAGVADHLQQPVARVRGTFAVLVVLGGVGIGVYVLLWALVPPSASWAPGSATAAGPPRSPSRTTPAERTGRGSVDRRAWTEHGPQLVVGAGLVAVGISMLAQRAGVAVEPLSVAALTVIVAGVLLAWGQLDTAERDRWLATAGGDTRTGLLRLGAGVVLAVLGIVLLVSGQVDPAALRGGVLAAGAVLLGVGLLVAPWVLRLGRDLVAERSARIRETERAEIAAHLHDSVLQTLALIQRRSADPAEVNRLARAQERQLRQWLYTPAGSASGHPGQPESGTRAGHAPSGLAQAVRDAVAEIEDLHAVPVEVVTVGDGPLDDDTRALVLALREAVLNAVRHGAPPVSVYVEVAPGRVEAFVRDHGPGVDLAQVPADRFGIRESVVGRMERHRGRAAVRRAPGGGTEVALSLGANGSAGQEA